MDHKSASLFAYTLREVNRGVVILVSLFILPVFLSTPILGGTPMWARLLFGGIAQGVWLFAGFVLNSVLAFLESYHQERIPQDSE